MHGKFVLIIGLRWPFVLAVRMETLLCRNGAQKLLGVLITIGEAVAYVVSGMYGDVRELGAGNAVLIILQVQRPSFDLHMLMAVDTSQRVWAGITYLMSLASGVET